MARKFPDSGPTTRVIDTPAGSTVLSLLEKKGVLKSFTFTINMDGKGRWVDNVFVERLWRSLNYEHAYLRAYEISIDAQRGIERYLRFYNTERRHQAEVNVRLGQFRDTRNEA